MKIDLTPQQLEVQHIAGDFGTIEAKIDQSSMTFLFEMMSKNLYSNPIGSVIREITSNCFDSHIEAKVDTAVIIKKGNDEEGDYISFNDFGMGLSPDRIKNIYMNYFSSTKRDTNDQIGGFGLGSKSPLSYTDYFYIITRFEGIKYTYIFSKGEKVPTLDLLSEESTEEHNGTEVRIHFKTDNDEYRFEEELKKQLCYFDNVYFQGWDIENEYKIYEHELYKFRNIDQYSDEMHICLGKVSYPIDWGTLDLDFIEIPVGVKFNIGELSVTPNRETLRYTDEIKELVRGRILEVKQLLIDKFNEQNQVITDFREWSLNKNERPHITFGTEDKLYLTGVKEISKKKKFKLFEELPYFYENHEILNLLYEAKKCISGGKEAHNLPYYSQNINNLYLNKDHKIAIVDHLATSGVKNWVFGSGLLLQKKNYKIEKKDLNFRTIFIGGLKKSDFISSNSAYYNAPKKFYFGDKKAYFNLGSSIKIYNLIKEFRLMFERFSVNYGDVTKEQQDAFTEMNRMNNKSLQRKLNKKVLITDFTQPTIGSGDKWINDSYDMTTEEIENYTGIIIYGNHADKIALQKAVIFVHQFPELKKRVRTNKGKMVIELNKYNSKLNPKAVKVISISKENEKYFKNHKNKNIMRVENLYSDNILFRRLASSFRIEEFFVNFLKNQTIDASEFVNKIKSISPQVGDNLETLLSYYKKYKEERRIENGQFYRGNIKQPILDVAKKFNLFDPEIEKVIEQVEGWFLGIELLKFTEINDNSLPQILKYLRVNKKKLDISYYQKIVGENIQTEQLKLFIEENNQTKFEQKTKVA